MEVKYNVSAFDNTPVTAGPEVHTGRAVFVDEELYNSDASYKAKVDKCIEEGFHKVVEGESGGSGGSGGDPGYSCTEGWVTLTDESVTTKIYTSGPVEVGIGFLAYDEFIDTDSIRVTFNGTEYTCQNFSSSDAYHDYGATPGDWSSFPFVLRSRDSGENRLMTETAGTYQIKIEAVGESVETSECFEKARGYRCVEDFATLTDEVLTFGTIK